MNAEEKRIYSSGPNHVLSRNNILLAGGWTQINLSVAIQYLDFMYKRDTIRAVQDVAYNSMFNGDTTITRASKTEDEEVLAARSKIYKPCGHTILRVLDALGFCPMRWIRNLDGSSAEHDPLIPVHVNIAMLTSIWVRFDINSQIEWEFYKEGKRGDGLNSVPLPGVYVIIRDPPRMTGYGCEIISRIASIYKLFEFADHKVKCETQADERRAFDLPISIQADANSGMNPHAPSYAPPSGEMSGAATTAGASGSGNPCSTNMGEVIAYRCAIANSNSTAVQIRQTAEEAASAANRLRPQTQDLPPGTVLAPNYHPPDPPSDTFVAMENALGAACQIWGIPRNAISTGNATGKATMTDGAARETSMMNQVFMDSQASTRVFLQTELEKLIFAMYFDHILKEEEDAYTEAVEQELEMKRMQEEADEETAAVVKGKGKKRKAKTAPTPTTQQLSKTKKKSQREVERGMRITVTMPIKQPTDLIVSLFDKGWFEPEAARRLLAGSIGIPLMCLAAKVPKTELEFKEQEVNLAEKTEADSHKVAMMKPAAGAGASKK
jgi:hypothetical protein